MGQLTISMAIFNSYVSYYQRLTLKKLSEYGDGNLVGQKMAMPSSLPHGETMENPSCKWWSMATLLMFSINNPGPRSDLHPDDGFLTSNMWN